MGAGGMQVPPDYNGLGLSNTQVMLTTFLVSFCNDNACRSLEGYWKERGKEGEREGGREGKECRGKEEGKKWGRGEVEGGEEREGGREGRRSKGRRGERLLREITSVVKPPSNLYVIYRLITAYLLLRVNCDKIMHARWDFDVSSARTRKVSALDKHQNSSESALFCHDSQA